MKYSEFEHATEAISQNTCKLINEYARIIQSEMPYKAQYLLEEVIKNLQERV